MTGTNILGVSAHFHDSAACLIRDGDLVAAAQEESFSRIKHDPAYPERAIRWCLESQGMDWDDIDWFAFYELPLRKMQRIADSDAAARGAGRRARPKNWYKSRPREMRDVGAMFPGSGPAARVLAVEHHASHAASAFFPSPHEEAAVVVVDGVGEYTTTSISTGRGNTITPLFRQSYPHSLGLFYSAFTHYCGFKVNSGEYKLMGLAPYGRPRYASQLESEIIKIAEDGSFRLNMDYFSFLPWNATGIADHGRLEKLLGRPCRAPESALDDFYADVAASVQKVYEKATARIARHARRLTGLRTLCMAGGGALNCVATSAIREAADFTDVWVQPASSDAGGALGAAYFTWHQRLARPRRPGGRDSMKGALLGPSFEDATIRRHLDSVGAKYRSLSREELPPTAARLLAEGKTLAWFQGPMEFGPRALGGRSILADPRSPTMRRHLNLAVKKRESFRPFAPAVTLESSDRYFESAHESPYMLFVSKVTGAASSPGNRPAIGAHPVASPLPAITHVDGSARTQTVDRRVHPVFWEVIERFGEMTGVSVVVNTSFNVRGEPIVCTPQDALNCFLRTELDYLLIGGHLLCRAEQTDIDNVDTTPIRELD